MASAGTRLRLMTSSGSRPEGYGHPLHQPLQCVVELRASQNPRLSPVGRLVGDDHAVVHREMGDAVGAGEVAVVAVERRGLGRAQVGAAVLKLVEAKRRDPCRPPPPHASIRVIRLVADVAASRCSSRSSIHLTGRAAFRAASAIATMSGKTACLMPKLPPESRHRAQPEPAAPGTLSARAMTGCSVSGPWKWESTS